MAKKRENKSEDVDIVSGALDFINKKFGAESIKTLGDSNTKVKRFSSGIMSLDVKLGGGLPVGRIIEYIGMESSGKTSAALHAVVNVQKNGGVAAYIDVEHAFDEDYAITLGVDRSKLMFAQPSNGEEALNIIDHLINFKKIDLIVLDSVDALQAQCEIDGEIGEAKMGVKARMMSQALRKYKSGLNLTDTTCIFINQMRENIGFSSGKTGSGGNGLKFYASVRCDFRKIGSVKGKEDSIGQQTKVKIIKNKVGSPGREVILETRHGFGFDPILDVVNLAIENGLIKQSGSWFSYEEASLGQGKEKVISVIKDNPDLLDVIINKLKEILL